MKLSGKILTSAIALGLAVQSLPAIVSYAEEEEWYFSTYKGEDGSTYLKVRLKEHDRYLTIPEEYNGEKIDKLNFRDISIPFDEEFGTNIVLFISLPESIELGYTQWKDMENGLLVIDVNSIDDNGNTKFMGTYKAQVSPISSAPPKTTNNNKGRWEYGSRDLAMNKLFYYTGNFFLDEYELEVPEDINLICDHWLARKTNILKIKLCYPSGKTETYTADGGYS